MTNGSEVSLVPENCNEQSPTMAGASKVLSKDKS